MEVKIYYYICYHVLITPAGSALEYSADDLSMLIKHIYYYYHYYYYYYLLLLQRARVFGGRPLGAGRRGV